VNDTRYHSVNLTWSNPIMSGLHVLAVDLTAEEQALVQPHITAIVDFWRSRALADNERTAAMGGSIGGIV
jgi:hypothetical protein